MYPYPYPFIHISIYPYIHMYMYSYIYIWVCVVGGWVDMCMWVCVCVYKRFSRLCSTSCTLSTNSTSSKRKSSRRCNNSSRNSSATTPASTGRKQRNCNTDGTNLIWGLEVEWPQRRRDKPRKGDGESGCILLYKIVLQAALAPRLQQLIEKLLGDDARKHRA